MVAVGVRSAMRTIFVRALLAGTLMLLSFAEMGFATPEQTAPVILPTAPAASSAATADPQSLSPNPSVISGTPEPTQTQPVTQIYKGTGSVVGAASPAHSDAATADSQGDITLNFVNVDVRDVAKAVLGDFLKLNYAVGASVQGTVTIQTSEPLPHDKILPVLEQALRLNGLALVKAENIYKIVPLGDAPHEVGAVPVGPHHGPLGPGYGVSIVPLRYVAATEMEKLLTPLAPAQAIIHTDPERNVLIIEGTEQERTTMLDDIALFDVDWLSGMSFALYTPRFADAEDLARELNQVVGGGAGPLAGVVRIVPITRLNAVLAISPQAKYLEHLRSWVERFDRACEGSDRRIFVYHVENGRASDLAAVVVRVLFGTTYELAAKHSPPPDDVFSSASQMAGGTAASFPPNSTPSLQSAGEAQEIFQSGGTGTPSKEMANVNITADEANNSLVIMASPQQFSVIENALHQLNAVPLQDMLEAAIAEVTLTKDLQYGVQYFFQPNNKQQLVLSNSALAAISPTYPGFSYIFSPGNNIQIILNALSSLTHVEVISSPQLLVLNNQTATLQVGDQVPLLTTQQQSTTTLGAPIVNAVEYHDTGVILKVTPRVNQGGNVMMDISQEVSEVADTTTTATLGSPTIEVRKINSTVAVHDGETIALGGLIQDSRTNSKGGIPYLSDIPFLGNLFRTTENDDTRTELMVLITPHVVDSTQKARSVTEELRRKLPTVQPILNRIK